MTELAADHSDSERGCNSFNLPISKQTQTHHFRVLREAGSSTRSTTATARASDYDAQTSRRDSPGSSRSWKQDPRTVPLLTEHRQGSPVRPQAASRGPDRNQPTPGSQPAGHFCPPTPSPEADPNGNQQGSHITDSTGSILRAALRPSSTATTSLLTPSDRATEVEPEPPRQQRHPHEAPFRTRPSPLQVIGRRTPRKQRSRTHRHPSPAEYAPHAAPGPETPP